MMLDMIKDIYIMYDENYESRIEDIKTIINNNYNLFISMMGKSKILSLMPTEEEDFIYIDDFDKTFYDLVKRIFANSNKNNETLLAFYIEVLLRKNIDVETSLIKPNPDVDEQMLYNIIAYNYFHEVGTFDDFVNYLKYRKDTDNILDWLKNKVRFDTYNYLLGIIVNYLKASDEDCFEGIKIIDKLLNQSFGGIINDQEQLRELPKIDDKEFDILVYSFLNYIKAPADWILMYNEIKNNNRIIFNKRTDGLNDSKCYIDNDGFIKILISADGTIRDFCSFIHEFIHYVSMCNELTYVQMSVLELPSIFFEKLSAEFLKDIGYDNNIIDKIIKERRDNNLDIYADLSPLFNDILKYINCGSVSRNDKIQFWENHFKAIQDTKDKILEICIENGVELTEEDLRMLKPIEVDIDGSVDQECDSLIDNILKNGLLVLDGYQYLLDTFLADEILKRTKNNPDNIEKMIGITINLCYINLRDILIEFNMEEYLEDNENKGNARTRNK